MKKKRVAESPGVNRSKMVAWWVKKIYRRKVQQICGCPGLTDKTFNPEIRYLQKGALRACRTRRRHTIRPHIKGTYHWFIRRRLMRGIISSLGGAVTPVTPDVRRVRIVRTADANSDGGVWAASVSDGNATTDAGDASTADAATSSTREQGRAHKRKGQSDSVLGST